MLAVVPTVLGAAGCEAWAMELEDVDLVPPQPPFGPHRSGLAFEKRCQ